MLSLCQGVVDVMAGARGHGSQLREMLGSQLACLLAAFAAAHAVADHEHALLGESGVLVVLAPKTHVTGHRDTDGACGHDVFPFLRARLTCVVCDLAACLFDSIATLFRESRVRILLKRGKEASIALRNWSTPVQYVVAWPDSMSCPENVA